MPVIAGPAGTAEPATLRPLDRDQEAALAGWLIHAPGQSPAWEHYMLQLCHLREMPGVRAASKQFPEAEHQVILLALDPKGRPDPDEPESWWPLTPYNALVQFGGAPSDEAAVSALYAVMEAIVNGQMMAEPPDHGWGRSALEKQIQQLIVRELLPAPPGRSQ
jgi:hypothetical protein